MTEDVYAYIGNWKIDGTDPLGISVCRFDTETGALEHLGTALPEVCVGETFLDAERRILYCTDERTQAYGRPGTGGRVLALAVDPATGALTELNQQPSYAALPSYVTTNRDRTHLLVTNHTRDTAVTQFRKDADGTYRVVPQRDDPTTVLYRLNADGSLGDVCDIHRHTGGGLPPDFLNPHPHAVIMSPSGDLFAVPDKGTDRIVMFRIDYAREQLVVCGEAEHLSGSGPRYGVFHPTRPYFFLNTENVPVLGVYRYDEQGGLERLSTVDALPADWGPDAAGAQQSDLCVSSSGDRLYELIRGADAVSVFAVDAHGGKTERIQTLRLRGRGPRGCALSPDGRFLLVAHVNSSDVLTLAVEADGRLAPTDHGITLPRPGNVTFYAATASGAAGPARPDGEGAAPGED